jgi:hypothetical protein
MQNLAFILIGIGVLTLVGYALMDFFADSEIHIFIRIAIGAVGIGVLILFGLAIKDRLKRVKTGDFKEMDK